jgi:pyruvate dehydrogenase E1 component alpha subunit
MAGWLRSDDALVSTHRNHAHALVKGVDPRALLAEIFERRTGLCRGYGGHMHPFDPQNRFSASGIVGASLPVALGHAYAARMEERDAVAVAVTGDGGANHGTFHECLTMASAWSLPLLVVIENNGLAISVEPSRPGTRCSSRGATSSVLVPPQATSTGSSRRRPMRCRPSSRRSAPTRCPIPPGR